MIFIIFPTQLFKNIKHLKNVTKIYLIEEPRFFTDFKFHKLKLAYHRATMKKYYDKLKKKFNITYVEYINVDDDFYKSLGQFTYIDTCDNILNDKLNKILKKNNCIDTCINTLHFLINPNEFDDIKKIIHNNNKYSHEKFYKYMRVKLDILMIEKSRRQTKILSDINIYLQTHKLGCIKNKEQLNSIVLYLETGKNAKHNIEQPILELYNSDIHCVISSQLKCFKMI